MKEYKFKATVTVPAGTRIFVDWMSYRTNRDFTFEDADIVSTTPPSTPFKTLNDSKAGCAKIGRISYKVGKTLTKANGQVPIRNTDYNYTSQRRSADGKFIKKDTIAEFDYPHSSNGLNQFRRIKVIKNTDEYLEGIQVNSGNTGFKRFKKSKADGIVIYKGYLD